MELLDDRAVFTRPRVLSTTPHSQVVRFAVQIPPSREKSKESFECVLKFFTIDSQVSYKKELAAYAALAEQGISDCPSALGHAEWSSEKYLKTLGKRPKALIDGKYESMIFVIMLQHVHGSVPLSSIANISPEIAKATLLSLSHLHAAGIVHGDISLDNILVTEGKDKTFKLTWIDFSCSWTNASQKQIEWEMEIAAMYVAQWTGLDEADLLQEFHVSAPEQATSSASKIEVLPLLPLDIKFNDWQYISEGTHAEIYRVRDAETGVPFCMKLFRQGWVTPFNLEKRAYEYLQHAEVEGCIPKVYGYGYRTLLEWGLAKAKNDSAKYNAIVMEWLEDAEQLSAENITVSSAIQLIEGLYRIHEAGLTHYDIYRRNMLVLPKENRGVWIDFSCAHINEKAINAQELRSAISSIMQTLAKKERNRGSRRMVRAYTLYKSNIRKVVSLLFSSLLALEGLAWLFWFSMMPGLQWAQVSKSTFNYGPLNIFTAALVATDSTAFHFTDTIFTIAYTVKLLYLLFTASIASFALTKSSVVSLHRTWIALRLIITLFWICVSSDDLLWWKDQSVFTFPGFEDDNLSEHTVSRFSSEDTEETEETEEG